MAGDCFVPDLRARAAFSPERDTKLDCFRSARLFAGLNCLLRGQSQRIHAHKDADKFYLVVSGKARIVVGAEARELSAGGMAWAGAGVPHGIEEALEDSVILVAMGPSPDSRPGG